MNPRKFEYAWITILDEKDSVRVDVESIKMLRDEEAVAELV